MISTRINQLKVIEERNAQAFEKAYNDAMLNCAKWSPTSKVTINPGQYTAIIEYMEEVKIPEDVRDEFALNGVEYVCGVCPFFSLPDDKRVKKYLCTASGKHRLCNADSRACVWLYSQILAGEVNI